MHISVPIEGTSEVIQFTQVSPLVSKCQIKVLYVSDEPNRNGSIITKEVAEEIGKNLCGSPIVGYYNKDDKDFEQHNRDLEFNEENHTFSLVDTTKAYGFVPTDAQVWFQDFQDDNSVVRTYLCTEGYIWTGAYPEAKRILEQGNNQSMELHSQSVKGSWTEDLKSGKRFFIVNEAIVEKLCVLGENFEPCFEGAQISNQFSLLKQELQDLRNNLYAMINDTFGEGGLNSLMENTEMKQEQTVAVEEVADTPIVEEFVKKEEETKKETETAPEDKNDKEDSSKNEENTEEEKKKKEYSLTDIPEYVELLDKYNALQTEFSAIKQEHDGLIAELEPLKTFKLEQERKDKQEMINSFYMLSDEDKADVVANIDNYSLDDIESKLSVICVRSRVNFSKEEVEEKQLNFSLSAMTENDNAGAPEWLIAVRETEKAMN